MKLQQLKSCFERPLPGLEAQLIMAPPYRAEELKNINTNDLKHSAVLLLLYQKQGRWCFPVIERALYPGVHSGQISLPGGQKDAADPDLLATALRENSEETGVGAEGLQILGELSALVIPPSGFFVQPFVAYRDNVPSFLPDEKEVQSVVELSLDDLLDPHNIHSKAFVSSSSGRQSMAPCYSLSGLDVWGATAMILSEFRELILRCLQSEKSP